MSNRSSHPVGPSHGRDARADDGFGGFEEDPLVELARIVSEGNAKFRPAAAPVEPEPEMEPPVEAEPQDVLVDHEAWARDLEEGLARDLGGYAPEPSQPVPGEPLGDGYVEDAYAEEAYAEDVYAEDAYANDAYAQGLGGDAGGAAAAYQPVAPEPEAEAAYYDEPVQPADGGYEPRFEEGYAETYDSPPPAAVPHAAADPYDTDSRGGDPYDIDPQYLGDPLEAGGYDPDVAAQFETTEFAEDETFAPQPQLSADHAPTQVPRSLADDLAASLESEFLGAPVAAPAPPVEESLEAGDWPPQESWGEAAVEEPQWQQPGDAYAEPAWDDAPTDSGNDDDFLLGAADASPHHAGAVAAGAVAAGSLRQGGYQWAQPQQPTYDDEFLDGEPGFDPEAPPPPGGYDLDAVAQAMRESDPHLGGHGVLPPHSEAEEEAAPARNSRRGLVVAGAVLGIVVLGGGAFALLDFGGDDFAGPPPLIAAGDEPLKVYPETDDKGASGQSKLIYDRVGGVDANGEERLVLPEDTPVASLPPAPTSQDTSGGETSLPSGPRRVRTVVVRPDGTIISAGDDAPAASGADGAAAPRVSQNGNVPASDTPRSVSTQPIGGTAANVGTDLGGAETRTPGAVSPMRTGFGTGDTVSTPSNTAGATQADAPANVPRDKPGDISTLAENAAPPPAARTQAPGRASTAPLDLTASNGQATQAPARTAAPVATGADNIPAGTYIVQVSSQRTQEQAQTAFNDLQRRFGTVLGGVNPVIQRADLGDRGTFYRVRIPAGSRDEAISLCERLKTAGGDCFVRRN